MIQIPEQLLTTPGAKIVPATAIAAITSASIAVIHRMRATACRTA
jgi:hypothetical protein